MENVCGRALGVSRPSDSPNAAECTITLEEPSTLSSQCHEEVDVLDEDLTLGKTSWSATLQGLRMPPTDNGMYLRSSRGRATLSTNEESGRK